MGLELILHYPKLLGSLFQMGDQMGSAIYQPKNKVIHPQARSLKM
jgi:hypothetical protein